jgi:hypothetical protein
LAGGFFLPEASAILFYSVYCLYGGIYVELPLKMAKAATNNFPGVNHWALLSRGVA